MPVFHYTAKDNAGDIVVNRITASNLEAAKQTISERGLYILNITEEEKTSIFSQGIFFITNQKIILFTRYFAVLVRSGISAFRALAILDRQERNMRFKSKLNVMIHEIENGQSLTQAFNRFPEMFSIPYRNLITIGEETGKLSEMLERAIDLMERGQALKRKFFAALAYPSLVVLLVVLLIVFAMTFIIPRFELLYWRLGLGLDQLPEPTKYLIMISNFVRRNIFFELAGLIFLIGVIYQVYLFPAGKYFIDNLLLKIPGLSVLLVKYDLSKFTRNLSVMFEAGFSVLKALDRSFGILTNEVIRRDLQQVAYKVENGVTLSAAFSETEVIPVMTTEMVLIGEETAAFDEMMKNVADFYERDLDYYLDIMMSMIQPILIIVLGAIVLVLLIAIYLPVFTLASKVEA